MEQRQPPPSENRTTKIRMAGENLRKFFQKQSQCIEKPTKGFQELPMEMKGRSDDAASLTSADIDEFEVLTKSTGKTNAGTKKTVGRIFSMEMKGHRDDAVSLTSADIDAFEVLPKPTGKIYAGSKKTKVGRIWRWLKTLFTGTEAQRQRKADARAYAHEMKQYGRRILHQLESQ